jgi:hypothetical protein
MFLYIDEMSFHIRRSLNFICFYIKLYIILLSTFSKLFARLFTYFVAKNIIFLFCFLIHQSDHHNGPNQTVTVRLISLLFLLI